MKLTPAKLFINIGIFLGIILALVLFLVIIPCIDSTESSPPTFKTIYLECNENNILCDELQERISNETHTQIVSSKKDAELTAIIDNHESAIKPMIFTGYGPSPFYEYSYQITAHFYDQNGEHISDQAFNSSSDIVATDYLHDYTIKYGYYKTYESESKTWADVYMGITYNFCRDLYSLYEFVYRKKTPYSTLYIECNKLETCAAFESIVTEQKLAIIVKNKDDANAIININNEHQSIANLESNKFDYSYTIQATITDKNGKQIAPTISANSSLTINTNKDYEYNNNNLGKFNYSVWSFIHTSAASILVNKITNLPHSIVESRV